MDTLDKPIRLLFVCHGNICRSPMAEFVMRDLAMKAGRANEFRIASAATTDDEIGNPVHPGTRRVLAAHGISCVGKTARRVKREEYKNWDLFVVMDDENVSHLMRAFRNDPDHRVHKLMEFVQGCDLASARDVADPWFTGDFEATWDDVFAGCQALLAALR